MYRVWHTDKKICSKFDEKQISKVTASNVKEARQKVLEMFRTQGNIGVADREIKCSANKREGSCQH